LYGDQHLYYEDVEVGQTWDSQTREVTSADIRQFADLTGDHNPIHVNEEYAATTPFGRTIAHGLLGLSIGSGLGINNPPMRTIAVVELKSMRFTAPIYPGDVVHTRTIVIDKERKGRGRRGLITWQRQLINQDNRIVQDGLSVTMVEAREPVKS